MHQSLLATRVLYILPRAWVSRKMPGVRKMKQFFFFFFAKRFLRLFPSDIPDAVQRTEIIISCNLLFNLKPQLAQKTTCTWLCLRPNSLSNMMNLLWGSTSIGKFGFFLRLPVSCEVQDAFKPQRDLWFFYSISVFPVPVSHDQDVLLLVSLSGSWD